MTRVGQIRLATAAALTITVVAVGPVAMAQEVGARGKTADNAEVKADMYSPQGVHVGAFTVLPSVEMTETHNSNVYAVKTGAKSDSFTTIAPDVKVQNNNQNFSFSADLHGESNFYNKYTGENTNNGGIDTNAKLTIKRGTALRGVAGYNLLHETRGDPQATRNTAKPTEYTTANAGVGFDHEFNRVYTNLDANIKKMDFNGATSRNRSHTDTAVRIGYGISPAIKLYAENKLNWVSYDNHPAGSINRDSDGYSFNLGTTLDLTGLLTGDIYAGYMNQQYTSSQFKSTNGMNFGTSLTWTPTQLTRIIGTVSRSVEQTTDANYSGYLATTGRVDVRHELRRNIQLSGYTSYAHNNYEKAVSTAASHTDNTYGAGLAGKYLLSNMVYVGADYNFLQQNSNPSTNGYTQHKAMARLGLQY